MKQYLYPLFLLTCWLLTAAGLNAQTPVAAYDFSGSAKDKSAFANHASVNGATLTQDRFGLPNSAFAFDGIQSAIRANNAAHLNSATATISFWINPKSFPAQGEAYLISFGGYQERFKISMPNHGKPVFTTHAGGACCSDMDSNTPLTMGTWTHVVMVHDGAKDIIYFNGLQVNEKNVAGALDASTKPLGIGYDPIDNTNFFNGSMDEVQFFDVALTPAQIAALYTAQNTPAVAVQGKVADYTFSGNGTDNTAFGNHADVSSGTLTTDRFGFGNSALSVQRHFHPSDRIERDTTEFRHYNSQFLGKSQCPARQQRSLPVFLRRLAGTLENLPSPARQTGVDNQPHERYFRHGQRRRQCAARRRMEARGDGTRWRERQNFH